VSAKVNLTVTLPTGHSPLGLYERLRHEHEAGRFTLNAATVFMLDEYVDLPSYPTGSFLEFLRGHLGPMVFNGSTTVCTLAPDGDPRAFDELLDLCGGLDLAIIGVGANGHVGFNEPGATPTQRTHMVELSSTTVADNFPGVASDQLPHRALTIGLADLVSARSVLMLVSGERKRSVAQMLTRGQFDPRVPATYLHDHPDLTVILEQSLTI
jgi:glucosamine-6-phosphate deaminase